MSSWFWSRTWYTAVVSSSFAASGVGWLAYFRLRENVRTGAASKELGAVGLPARAGELQHFLAFAARRSAWTPKDDRLTLETETVFLER